MGYKEGNLKFQQPLPRKGEKAIMEALSKLATALGSGKEPIRVVASDIDGTLTTQGRLSPEVVRSWQALQQANISTVLVTGRAAGYALALFSTLGANACIAENGGVIYLAEDPERPLCRCSPEGEGPIWTHPKEGNRMSSFQAEGMRHFKDLQQQSLLPNNLGPTHDNLFRLSDFTFSIQGLQKETLAQVAKHLQSQGLSFVHSSIHAHIMPPGQNKGEALEWLCQKRGWLLENVLTVGDSPNDASLFAPPFASHSVGVRNLELHLSEMSHLPRYLTEGPEGEGFVEIAQVLLDSHSTERKS